MTEQAPDPELSAADLALGEALRAQLPTYRAPDALVERVRVAARGAPARRSRMRAWQPLALAASLAIVAIGGWQLGASNARRVALSDQVLASHVRSLMPGHLTDVLSTDQHTVKPWFNGRLDFSPSVTDYSARGYPLVGGRLDYVGGRSVAALVYGRRQHVINVFVWPVDESSQPASAVTRHGYHLIHWSSSGFAYWVASDLGMSELQDFTALLKAQ